MQIISQRADHFSNFSKVIIILSLIFSFSAQFVGAKGLMEMSLEELMTLQVTSAAKTPTSLMKTPAAIYVITQEDIRRSGANSISELFNHQRYEQFCD